MRHCKKSVVRVAQHVATLVQVQGLSSLLLNMYCLFDSSSTFVQFSVQNSGSWPVDHVVIVRCMVSQCKPFTRNQHASSVSEQNKSALTDHASHDNHVINWQELEEELIILFLMKVSHRDRNVKGKNVGCVKLVVIFVIILVHINYSVAVAAVKHFSYCHKMIAIDLIIKTDSLSINI